VSCPEGPALKRPKSEWFLPTRLILLLPVGQSSLISTARHADYLPLLLLAAIWRVDRVKLLPSATRTILFGAVPCSRRLPGQSFLGRCPALGQRVEFFRFSFPLQVCKYLLDHHRVFDTGNHFDGTTACFTSCNIKVEHPFQALCLYALRVQVIAA